MNKHIGKISCLSIWFNGILFWEQYFNDNTQFYFPRKLLVHKTWINWYLLLNNSRALQQQFKKKLIRLGTDQCKI